MATLTTTLTKTSSRPRRFSLSLVSARPTPFLNLPAELVLDILELALSAAKPSTLATISKLIAHFIDIILYRTVVLHSKESVTLFHRTTLSRPPSFFASHVKKLVVTAVATPESVSFRRVKQVISTCSGVRSLVLSQWFGIDCMSSVMANRADGGLSEIILRSHEGMDSSPCAPGPLSDTLGSSITHLRVCEPGETGWMAPDSILSPFGTLPNLSHLQLARRINANVDNDHTFEKQVRDILETRPMMSRLAVAIFPQAWAPFGDVRGSDIWKMMQTISEEDKRLFVCEGKVEEWDKAWRHARVDTGRDFWIKAATEAAK